MPVTTLDPTNATHRNTWGERTRDAFDDILNTARTAFEFPIYDKGGVVFHADAYATVADAITAALAVDGVVQLGPKLYTAAEIPAVSGLHLRGAGADRTTFKLANSSDAYVLAYSGATTTGVILEDLTIDANGANQSATSGGVQLVDVHDSFFRRVRVTGTMLRGFDVFGCSNLRFDHCTVDAIGTGSSTTDGTKAGFHLSESSRIQLIGCVADTVKDCGFVLSGGSTNGCSDIVSIGCRAYDCDYIGHAFGTLGERIILQNAVALDCTDNGIDWGSIPYVVINGCIVDGCGNGIIGDGNDYDIITNNIALNSTGTDIANLGYGIGLIAGFSSVRGCIVANNYCAGNRLHGFVIQGTNHDIHGNIAHNNSEVFAGFMGFRFDGLTNSIIYGNRAYDDRGTKQQDYGFEFIGTTAGNEVYGNHVSGNLTGGMVFNGGTSVTGIGRVLNNAGYVAPGDTIIGSGSPEGVVTAPIGTMYRRTDGSTSTTLYVKTSGTGNTGWTAK